MQLECIQRKNISLQTITELYWNVTRMIESVINNQLLFGFDDI